MYLDLIFRVVQRVITKQGARKKLFCISGQKERRHISLCDVCFYVAERRIECYVIMENDLLGTNNAKASSPSQRG